MHDSNTIHQKAVCLGAKYLPILYPIKDIRCGSTSFFVDSIKSITVAPLFPNQGTPYL